MTTDPLNLPWYLVGLPGSGKSKVGKILAGILNVPHIDIDAQIEAETGRTINAIFEEDGEQTFRRLEAEAVLATAKSPAVVSLGGGAVETPAVARFLENRTVVWIDAPLDLLLVRVSRNNNRPLLRNDPRSVLTKLKERRDPIFKSLASVRVESSSKPAQVTARAIFNGLTGWDYAAVRGTKPYFVVTGPGTRHILGNYLPSDATKAFLVAPAALAEEAEKIAATIEECGLATTTFLHPNGEQAKDISVVADAWDTLGEARVGRRDLVITLGGGVTTDLGGFIAATWLRGIPVIHLPTTLLAMVDAAVGGKTGIDIPAGKNLVGAFHDPLAVLVDIDFLTSLPQEEYAAGMAEAVKTGLIEDAQILNQIQAHPEIRRVAWASSDGRDIATDIVRRSIDVKARIVSADRLEGGLREVLNYGHTLAHAIERAENYTMRHGEAVAIGAVFAAHLAVQLGIAPPELPAQHEEAFTSLGLPTRYSGDVDVLLEGMATDKKVRQGQLRFVLLSEVGNPFVRTVDPEMVRKVASQIIKTEPQ